MNRCRKISVLALVLSFALLFSGCIKSDMHMTIHKNRSMDFSLTYLVAEQYANVATGEDVTVWSMDENSEKWKALAGRGYSVAAAKEAGYVGMKATRHYDSIDDLSSEGGIGLIVSNFFDPEFDDSKFFSVRRHLWTDTYTAHFVYDLKDMGDSEQQMDATLTDPSETPTLTYSVTLPCEPTYQNAGSISGDRLTYTWKIPCGQLTAIDYTFTLPSRNVMYAICGGAGLLLLAVIVVVLIVLLKKRKAAAPKNEDLPAPKTEEEAASLTAAAEGAEKEENPTVCPLCGGKVSVRKATGAQAGKEFAVCEHYPTCKFLKPAVKPAAPITEKPTAPQAPATPVIEKPVAPQAPAAPVIEKPTAPQAPAAPVAEKPTAPQAPAAPVVEKPVAPQAPAAPVAEKKPLPVCPLCGGKLAVRRVSSGTQAGKKFVVCEHYPTCKFAKPVNK